MGSRLNLRIERGISVTPKECRERARECRVNAFRSWGKLQADFVAAAEAWDLLADQLDRQQAVGVVVVKSTSDPTDV